MRANECSERERKECRLGRGTKGDKRREEKKRKEKKRKEKKRKDEKIEEERRGEEKRRCNVQCAWMHVMQTLAFAESATWRAKLAREIVSYTRRAHIACTSSCSGAFMGSGGTQDKCKVEKT